MEYYVTKSGANACKTHYLLSFGADRNVGVVERIETNTVLVRIGRQVGYECTTVVESPTEWNNAAGLGGQSGTDVGMTSR